MAKAKFGSIVTDVRGKLGGHVFQGNGFSTSLRTNYSGKGGLEQRANLFKEKLPAIQDAWLNESSSVQEAWALLARQNPLLGTFNNWVFLSAKNMYIRHYMAYFGAGFTGTIDIANAVNDLPSSNLQHVEFNFSTQEIDVQFAFDRFSDATSIYAKPVNDASLKIHADKLPWIYGEVDETPQDDLLWDAFFAKYPNVQEGDPVQFGVKQVNQYGFQSFVKTVYGTYA